MLEVVSTPISAQQQQQQEDEQMVAENGEQNGEERKKLLYVIFPERDCRYSVHAIDICDTEMKGLKEPILKVEDDMVPFGSSVAAVNSQIFMVGGKIECGPKERVQCRRVRAFDTVSTRFYEAPPLNSGKSRPVLLVSGSKLFALSNILHDTSDNPLLDPKPWFEVLDTQNLNPNPKPTAWRVLPKPEIPSLSVRSMFRSYKVKSHVVSASGDFLFISIPTPGTYAFDVANECWTHLSGRDLLPFKGEAKAVALENHPNDSLLYALSAGHICAFRLHYDISSTSPKLMVDPIHVVYTPPFPSVAIPKLHQTFPFLVPLDGDRLCLILAGLDKETMSYHFDLDSTNRHIVLSFCWADKSSYHFEEMQHKHRKVDPEKKKSVRIPQGLKQQVQSCNGEELNRSGQEEIRLTKWERRCLSAGAMGDHMCHVSAAYFM